MPDLDQVTQAVISSKKYGAVCEETVRRIASRELAKYTNAKRTIKATKRRLHQVYGAFEQGLDYDTHHFTAPEGEPSALLVASLF